MEIGEMVDMIAEALYMYDHYDNDDEISSINTYDEEGLLTNDEGIVVRLKDQKSAFHITVTEHGSWKTPLQSY